MAADIPMTRVAAILLVLLLPSVVVAGKHLEIMVPAARQDDLKGRPRLVKETRFEVEDVGQRVLESKRTRSFDKKGNLLRNERFDSAGRTTNLEIYGYGGEGTWISLREISEAEGSDESLKIILDKEKRRIAQTRRKTGETEYLLYSEAGFESGGYTKSREGKTMEQFTIRRNDSNKEELILVERPPGTAITEVFIEWNERGFMKNQTMIFHDEGGDRIEIRFAYPKVDARGNWLTRIEARRMRTADGRSFDLPLVTIEREIEYHE